MTKPPPSMTPRIEILKEKKLIGKRMKMSFANLKMAELWKEFGQKRALIKNNLNNELISLVNYQPDHFTNFSPINEFEKWAAVEVQNDHHIPEGLESLTLPGGLYAVFDYKGSSNDHSIFQYIYSEWLPNSPYQLDHRPHFEILGDKYKNNDPNSEEEIWIPIKPN